MKHLEQTSSGRRHRKCAIAKATNCPDDRGVLESPALFVLGAQVRLVFSCWWETTDDPVLKFKPASFLSLPLCFINDYLKVPNMCFCDSWSLSVPFCFVFCFDASMNYATG